MAIVYFCNTFVVYKTIVAKKNVLFQRLHVLCFSICLIMLFNHYVVMNFVLPLFSGKPKEVVVNGKTIVEAALKV